VVFWSVTVGGKEDGTSTIRVTRQEPLEEKPGQAFDGTLNKPATKKLWKEAKRVSMWTLPKTNYNENMSDDCYHLGVSLELRHKDMGNYLHQIPTGSCVVVSNINPSKNEMLRFLTFVKAIAQIAEKVSNVRVPSHAKLRWESRIKEMNALGNSGGITK